MVSLNEYPSMDSSSSNNISKHHKLILTFILVILNTHKQATVTLWT